MGKRPWTHNNNWLRPSSNAGRKSVESPKRTDGEDRLKTSALGRRVVNRERVESMSANTRFAFG